MDEFNMSETELEFGEVLYEKSNAKSMYDAPSGKVGAKGIAQRIYMILLGLVLFTWFLYSFTKSISENGFVIALINHLAPFFVLFVCEFILILTAFNAWGKFLRHALQHKSLKRKHGIEGLETKMLEEELKAADENKSKECALRIYRDHIIVINNGEKIILNRSSLKSVNCENINSSYQLTFMFYDGTQVKASVLLPLADLPFIKKHFDNFIYTPAKHEKGYFIKKLPFLAFLLIPILIGIAIIIVHCLVIPDMPIIFGIVFLTIGILIGLGQFDDIPIVSHSIMPIGGGIVFIMLPVGILLTIVDLVKISLVSLLADFTVIHSAFAIFFGFGPMLIIIGISGFFNCIRMKKN
ncbi:MAG: hypothetical protein J1F32_03905 [Erysipelotrichales bacterium]|nr:hypothetical protein [Erysipelotrichales bacterium]